MTKKEIEIQTALGVIEPGKLSTKEFIYWPKLILPRHMINEAMATMSMEEFYNKLQRSIGGGND